MDSKGTEDTYFTPAHRGEAKVTEKMSRFLAFAIPVKSVEEARSELKNIQNSYHDARHVCWAYKIGPHGEIWQLNDNGEPSGTAGKPIYGQLNSFGVTDVLLAVVRYFGGIKLGTSGLISAYREAARLALENAGKKECHEMEEYALEFGYLALNDVMKVMKGGDVEVLEQNFDNTCFVRIAVRKDFTAAVTGKLGSVEGISITPKGDPEIQ